MSARLADETTPVHLKTPKGPEIEHISTAKGFMAASNLKDTSPMLPR